MRDIVSIIMPSYNTEDYILESIESVINQTYDNWELIVVDDCSSDGSRAILSRLNDPRIRVIYNKEHCGAAYSRNLALSVAKGRWIAFLDSDDIWINTKLEKQINFMEKGGYSFSYTQYRVFNNDDVAKDAETIVSGPKVITHKLMKNYCWPGCLTIMYDKMKLGDLQIVEIEKNNDYAMWLELSKRADCILLPEALAVYRRGREGSISSKHSLSMLRWHYLLFRRCENMTHIGAISATIRNVVFGIVKRVTYTKKRNL